MSLLAASSYLHFADGTWGLGLLFDPESGLRCFEAASSETSSRWVMIDGDHFSPAITVDGSALCLRDATYNGSPCWGGSSWYGGYGAVFRSVAGTWIYNPNGLREPHAWPSADDSTVLEGDGWWGLQASMGTLYADDFAISAIPLGTFSNAGSDAVAPTFGRSWPRWERDASLSSGSTAPCGVYVAKGGATPARRTVGCMRFDMSGGGTWVEALDGLSFVRINSGASAVLRWREREGLWTWGDYMVEGSWWYQTANAPTRENGATLEAWKLDAGASAPVRHTAADRTMTFSGYVAGLETETIYMAEVAQWR